MWQVGANVKAQHRYVHGDLSVEKQLDVMLPFAVPQDVVAGNAKKKGKKQTYFKFFVCPKFVQAEKGIYSFRIDETSRTKAATVGSGSGMLVTGVSKSMATSKTCRENILISEPSWARTKSLPNPKYFANQTVYARN